MTSLAGMLAGLSLVIGGAALHDENYAPNDPRLYGIDSKDFKKAKEGLGYLFGVAGGATLALSTQEALDRQPHETSLPEALAGMALGGGLVVLGVNVHNNTVSSDNDWSISNAIQLPNDNGEHLGYLLGPLGAVVFALSAQEIWDRRGRRVELVPALSADPGVQMRVRF